MNDLDLWSQDTVLLAEGVSLSGSELLDSMTDRRIALNETAALLIRFLAERKSVGKTVDYAVVVNGWDSAEVTVDLIDLLDELDKSALLVVKKDWKARLRPSALWLRLMSWLTLEWPRPATRRYAPTAASLAYACLKISALGFFLSGAMTIALFLATLPQGGAAPIPQEKHIYVAVPLFLYLFFIGHVIIHETGHLLAANYLEGGSSKYIFIRGARMGVAHDILSSGKRRIVALCGPLAGLLGAQLIALLFLAVPFLSPLASLMSLSGLIHLYSLFPWTADGKHIWQRKEGDGES